MSAPIPIPNALLVVRRYVLRAVGELDLAPYLGATIRGAVGRALRQLVCATRMPACEGCPVRSACVYAMLHDGYTPPGVAAGTGEHAPPPLWLRDVAPGRRMQPGETLEFSVAAFGPAARSLPFLDEAVRGLRRSGIGRGRGVVELVEVADEQRAELGALLARRADELERGARAAGQGVRVRLRTPVAIRLKGPAWAGAGRPRPSWVERLVGGAVRRRIALERRWLELPLSDAPRVAAAVADAAGAEVLEEQVMVRRVPRYSASEGRHVEFHGVVGALRLGGEGLPQALPWLCAAELLSVGSGTTFGFGRVELEVA
ncbi:MAG: CRISPR system precrRNA processing endoribonuclease RAMP protein Cas6 [Polyangiaceae bacterium]|nr:CRISPR system precrRNA processing endoribonuclease RAMP protein Cas6 [Polyangiaceae bacterium]